MDTEELSSRNVNRTFASARTNGESERLDLFDQKWFATLLGAGLLIGASARRSLPLALAGGMLVYRGVTGRWAFSDLIGLGGAEKRHPATSVAHQTGIKAERSILIDKSPEELYRFWRNLENLPRFMSHVSEVKELEGKRSHWKIKSLGGANFEWDAEIINEIPNELLAWRSLEGSDVDHAGSVHFEPNPHGGTRVTVVIEYRPPAGKLGAEVARVLGQEPPQLIEKDLQSLKHLMEGGEIPSIEGQPQGQP
jgi:uncharacterized membrane protein